ncbi:hypothetical protein SCYAM73S_04102 [Streptomyces cyaneofuscatus]
MIVPTGIATDATTQDFFKDLLRKGQLEAIFSFDNEEKLFPQVTNRVAFCLFMLRGEGNLSEPAKMVFKLRQPEQIPQLAYELTASDILRMNPNTGTCLSRCGKPPPPRADLLPPGCQLPGQEPQGAGGQVDRRRVDKHTKLLADTGDLG